MRVHLFAGACVCALSAPDAFGAFGVIDDKSFFDGIEHTFLDFETKGDGSPVDLPLLGAQRFGPEEYANFGVLFDTGASWGNFELSPIRPISQSLDAVGSAPTAIGGGIQVSGASPSPSPSTPSASASSRGGWRAGGPSDDRRIMKDLQTRMRAFDKHGLLLGEAFFWDNLVDGGFGGPWKDGFFGEEFLSNPFGFLGVFSPDTPIDHVRFTHGVPNGVIFDDLHFSALPAPGPGAALALFTLGAALRRRR